jgi:chemotaxis response regulator CheB
MKDGAPSAIEVLVVDDSAVVRQLMGALLTEELGFHVTAASDPLVAMAKMRRHRPHVILLDLEMPRMHGLTFLRRIVASDPIPVVVCSGDEAGLARAGGGRGRHRAQAAGLSERSRRGQRSARHRARRRPGAPGRAELRRDRGPPTPDPPPPAARAQP